MKLRRAFANKSSAFQSLAYPKLKSHKIEHSGGYLSRILEPLLKTGLPLMKNVLRPLAKSVS